MERQFTVALPYASVERVCTPDGCAVALRRVPRPEGARPAGPPVVIAHGLGVNHKNCDLEPEGSLARHLAARGRDVYLVTLRSGRCHGPRSRGDVCFESMVLHDLPVAIDAVRERSGGDRVDYIGFSMGGMLLYAALGRSVDPGTLRRAVLIGSPGRIDPPFAAMRLLRALPLELIPDLVPPRLLSLTIGAIETPLHHVLYNPRNCHDRAARVAITNALVDVPARLGADFARWILADGELRAFGERVLDGLARVDTPALFVAGARDRLAPPPAVRLAYDAWGSDRPGVQKQMRIVGRATGADHDYGHGDLAIGSCVTRDVCAPVEQFLAAA